MNHRETILYPLNKNIDFHVGDYLIADVMYDCPKCHKECVRVKAMYPGITICVRTNGREWCVQNNQYKAGFVTKANASDIQSFKSISRRHLC